MSEDRIYAAFAVSAKRCVTVTSDLREAVEHLERGFIVRQVTAAEARAIWGTAVPDVYNPTGDRSDG